MSERDLEFLALTIHRAGSERVYHGLMNTNLRRQAQAFPRWFARLQVQLISQKFCKTCNVFCNIEILAKPIGEANAILSDHCFQSLAGIDPHTRLVSKRPDQRLRAVVPS